jgi:hypothetical protein
MACMPIICANYVSRGALRQIAARRLDVRDSGPALEIDVFKAPARGRETLSFRRVSVLTGAQIHKQLGHFVMDIVLLSDEKREMGSKNLHLPLARAIGSPSFGSGRSVNEVNETLKIGAPDHY